MTFFSAPLAIQLKFLTSVKIKWYWIVQALTKCQYSSFFVKTIKQKSILRKQLWKMIFLHPANNWVVLYTKSFTPLHFHCFSFFFLIAATFLAIFRCSICVHCIVAFSVTSYCCCTNKHWGNNIACLALMCLLYILVQICHSDWSCLINLISNNKFINLVIICIVWLQMYHLHLSVL